MILRLRSTAEFRGPGVRHRFEDSGDDYDLTADQRTGRSGKIILLGDGTEVLTDSDDPEIFDHIDEDKDLESQVPKGQVNPKEGNHETRSDRQDTPGPQAPTNNHQEPTSEPVEIGNTPISEKFSSTGSIPADAKVVPNSALPEKLMTPSKAT